MLSIHIACASSSYLSPPASHKGRQPSPPPGSQNTRVLALRRRRTHRGPPVFASPPQRRRIIFRRWSSMPRWKCSSPFLVLRRVSRSVLFSVHLRKVYGRSVCVADIRSAARITTVGSRDYIWKRGIASNIQFGHMQRSQKKRTHFPFFFVFI